MKSTYTLCILLSVFLLKPSSALLAQAPSGGWNSSGTNGNPGYADHGNGIIQLTNSTGSGCAGAAVSQTTATYDPTSGGVFSKCYQTFFGCPGGDIIGSSSKGDGMAFSFSKGSFNVGNGLACGGGLGYMGASSKMITIEFDTYSSQGGSGFDGFFAGGNLCGAPAASGNVDEVSLHFDGNASDAGLIPSTCGTPNKTSSVSAGNLDDGKVHIMCITYNPATHILSVTKDGSALFSYDLTGSPYDLATYFGAGGLNQTWSAGKFGATAPFTVSDGASISANTAAATAIGLPIPPPTLPNKTICAGDPAATFDVGAGYTAYLWSANGTGTAQSTSGTTAGNYTVNVTNAAGCMSQATGVLTVKPLVTPTFAAIPPFCSGTTAPTLPTSSTNTPAISGTWNPSTVSNTASGTYTFTPTGGQCATTTTLNTTVNPTVNPTFAAVAPFCSGSPAPTLPTSSTNSPAITGTWSPSPVSNTASGTYTFTPAAGQCATTATLNTTVNPVLTPVVSCGAITNSSVAFSWTAVSGVTGYSLSYTVAGGAAQSGGTTAATTYNVTGLSPGNAVVLTVSPQGTGCYAAGNATCTANNCSPITVTVPASFTICNGATVPVANFVSSPAGATFTWTNSNTAIGLAASGTTSQIAAFTATNTSSAPITASITVTPTIAPCTGTSNTYVITVNPTITPTFSPIPAFCSGTTAPTLSSNSTNTPAVNGTWNPAAVSNTTGATYTFTPAAGQCAINTTLTTTVNTPVTPTFTAIAPFCSGTTAPALPSNSTNTPAVPGTWNPAAVSNTASNTYTFTPATGQCATTASLSVTVNPTLTPIVSCGTTTNSSVPFNWTATSGASGYSLAYTKNGGAAISAGTVAGTTYTVSGLSPGDAIKLTVTPTGTGCFAAGNATCTANNCTPITVAVPANFSICNGASVPLTNFVSTPGGATFSWVNSNASIGLAVSGTGQIASFTATNSTNAPITATITVTPTIAPCTGTSSSYTITVNPTIVTTFAALAPFCSGGTTPVLSTSSTNSPAITGTWSPATVSNTTSGQYTFIPSAGQCATTGTLNSTVNAPITPSFAAIPPFCSGSVAPVLPSSSNDSPPITGTWSPTAVSNTASGTYTFTPGTGQCANSTTLNTTVNSILIPTVTCGTPANNSVAFNWTATTNANSYSLSYTINGGAATAAPATSNLTYAVNPVNPGDVVALTVTPVGSGCYAAGNTTCMATPCSPITVTVPAPISVCSNATIPGTTFTSTPAGANFAWTCSDPSIGLAASGNGQVPSFTAINSGTVTVTATITVTPSITPCKGTPNSYTITVTPTTTATFDNIPAICNNSSAPLLPASSTNIPAITGTWNPATVSTTKSGTYVFTPQAGCYVGNSLQVIVVDSIKVTAGPDVTVCSGELVKLDASSSGASSYLWSNGSAGSSINVAPATTTIYVVKAFNGPCTATSRVTVNIKNPGAPTLFIPNAFSPNGDNLNETFRAYGEGIVEIEGNIFNRWGELIYKWKEMDQGWDGKSGTGDQINDVYVYSIKVKNICQKNFEPVKRGIVTVEK